jgi:ATP-binding cassette subfamily F protein 3
MLTVSSVSKRFPGAETPILKDISFTVNAGERVGLIGPNGAGKTTLLHIITGDLEPDSGSVHLSPPDLRIGYLAQGLDAPPDATVRAVLLPQEAALHAAEGEVERLATALAHANGDYAALSASYAEALDRLTRLDGDIDLARGEQLLASLGLGGVPLDWPVSALSGGQKTRLGLAAILAANPQLLLLDEPTNHLDITALEWLEDWLLDFEGGALIVSHDRTFLDEVADRIVALDERTATVRTFEGGYSGYAAAIRSELDKQWAQWRDQQVEIARLKADAQFTMQKAIRRENATNNDFQRRLAKKVAKRAKAKETRLNRYLESAERVDKPAQTWGLKLDFGQLPSTGQDVIALEALSIGYDAARPLLQQVNAVVRAGERIAVLGPNGQGKSTLLKTIIGELPPLAGRVRRGSSVKIGYLAQEQEILDMSSDALQTIQAESGLNHTDARSFLHYFLFAGDDVFRPIRDLSFGERARLMLAVLVARGANLLVLDEPINHLDVPSRERFETALGAFQGSVIAVVHDRYFVDRFAHTVWHVEDGQLVEDIRQNLAL